MKKRTTIIAGALALGLLTAAGNGNGNVGCELANGDDFKNPGQMLKHLTARDGHFQNTVETYDFGTVANLIDKKCGA